MADGTDSTGCVTGAPNKNKPTLLSPLKASLAAESSRSPTHIPYKDESAAPATAPVFTSPLSRDEIRDLLWKEASYDCNAPTTTPKRATYLSWDDYFMAIAFLSARRSKDPKAPTGACLVDSDNRVIGIGYNGFPRGCSDDLLPWQDSASSDAPILHTSSPYECHAEMNAILNKCSADVVGATLYTPHYPCNECAKMIAQSRIREVVYIRDDHRDSDVYRASRIILHMAGVKTRQYTPTIDRVVLDLRHEGGGDDAVGPMGINTTNSTDTTQVAFVSQPDDTDTTEITRRFHDLLAREANWVPSCSSTKRTDYLSWDDYFMAMAFLTAQRSKDPNTQVGACIVSRDKLILALGYNGFPRGCSDDCLPWSRHATNQNNNSNSSNNGTASSSSSLLHTKYAYVCHAEVNAILNKCSANVKDATLYVALFPCNECAKMIIQAGIEEVVYLQNHYHDTDMCRASRILFGMAGVKLRHYVPTVTTIPILFEPTPSADIATPSVR